MTRLFTMVAGWFQPLASWVRQRGALGMVAVVTVSVIAIAGGASVTVAVSRAVAGVEAAQGDSPSGEEQREPDEKAPDTDQASGDGLPDAGGPADKRVNSELANKLGHEFYTDDPWLKQTTTGVSVDFRPGGAYVKIFLACKTAGGGARISDGQALNVPFSCTAAGQASQSSGFYPFSCPSPTQLTVSLWGTKLDGNHVYAIPTQSQPTCGPVVVSPPSTESPAPASPLSPEPSIEPTPTPQPEPELTTPSE